MKDRNTCAAIATGPFTRGKTTLRHLPDMSTSLESPTDRIYRLGVNIFHARINISFFAIRNSQYRPYCQMFLNLFSRYSKFHFT